MGGSPLYSAPLKALRADIHPPEYSSPDYSARAAKVHFPILIEKVKSDSLFPSASISPASLYPFNLALS
jgi:hypothetical protein